MSLAAPPRPAGLPGQESASVSKPIDFSKPIEYSLLKGKNALVTGGASGLGEGIVTILAKSGANVVIADRNEELALKLEKTLNEQGYSAKAIPVDVTSWPSQITMLTTALAWLPNSKPLDMIVTSAGVAEGRTDLSPRDPATLDPSVPLPAHGALSVGTLGTFYTVTLALQYGMGLPSTPLTPEELSDGLPEKNIVLVGSMAGYSSGIPGNLDYSASKYSLRGMWRSLQSVSLETGVRCNILTPYFIRTPMTEPVVDALLERGLKLGTVEDVAEAVARFATDSSVHGRAVCIHGSGLEDMRDDAGGAFGARALGEMHARGIM